MLNKSIELSILDRHLDRCDREQHCEGGGKGSAGLVRVSLPSTSGHRVENVGTLTREQGVCKNFLTLISMLAISEMNGLRREAVEDWRKIEKVSKEGLQLGSEVDALWW